MNGTVHLEARTFADLVGRHTDVYLFRVSQEFLDDLSNGEWNGPVEYRCANPEGSLITLEMRKAEEPDALLDALKELHADLLTHGQSLDPDSLISQWIEVIEKAFRESGKLPKAEYSGTTDSEELPA